ncbi:hypothetical protein EUTSA_v10003124mg [Eutrema salsugineum]|uniref:Uncharacterized protein n=1 Tax=Eutrema salsugineum TaxID=72664 RepID=V4MYF5_EUTSA|nr:hypothetical protein EUTSA_v10003124mg [Eutrema salsugineum]
MEMRLASLESGFHTFSSTVTDNMDAMRQAQNVLLQSNGIDPDTLCPIVDSPAGPNGTRNHQDPLVSGESVGT